MNERSFIVNGSYMSAFVCPHSRSRVTPRSQVQLGNEETSLYISKMPRPKQIDSDWSSGILEAFPADSRAHLLAPIFDRKSAAAAKKIGSGLAAGPGAASGHVVFSANDAVKRAEKGEKVVLARIETSPEDLRGMIAAEGILTSRG